METYRFISVRNGGASAAKYDKRSEGLELQRVWPPLHKHGSQVRHQEACLEQAPQAQAIRPWVQQ